MDRRRRVATEGRVILEHWGATGDEISGPMPGDDLVTDPMLVATRSITLDASPDDVFPWLRQMGFGRAGWYSYDWLDNLGRRSATRVHPEWQDVNAGDAIPGGPIDFTAVTVEPPHALVLALVNARIAFTLAYRLDPVSRADRTRVVTRVRSRIDVPGGSAMARRLLGPGDGIMLRKQLLTLSRRAATPQAGPSRIER
ncbi:MAG: hypothetical protein RIR49_1924 [Actinomycetota bacterium]